MRFIGFTLVLVSLAGCGSREITGTVLEPEPTATDQSMTSGDLALVGQVRRRLVVDRDLSLRAKNIVVVVRDGVVTLRGHVRDERDHDLLVQKVASVPDVVRLDDRLTWS